MATSTAPVPAAEPAPLPPRKPLGGPFRSFIVEAGDMAVFSGQVIVGLIKTPRYAAETLRQAAIIYKGTTLLLFVMNAFLGFSVANFAFFFLRSIGASDYLGVASGFAEPRLLATVMFGYVFTAKVCTGTATEIGAMKTNDEISALEATGVDPLHYVVGTRVLAALLFVPIATIAGLLGELAGTYFAAVVILEGIAPQVLLDTHWSVQTAFDQFFAFITIFGIALTTAIVACFYGLRAHGGPASVGQAAARSLAVNIIIVHIIAAVSAVFFYGTDLNLPIGG